jgi:hypothetical protein
MKYGIDALGGNHFEKELLKVAPVGGVGGLFLRTFGNAHKSGERFVNSQKFSEFLFHSAPFDRSHRYPVRDLLSTLRADAAWAERLSRANPNVVVMFSPFCEHNHPRSVMEPVFMELQRIAPSVLMVNSIWKGEQVPGIITEIHIPSSKLLPGIPRGEFTVSWDGCGGDPRVQYQGDFPDTDVPTILAHYARARHIRLWNFRCNGKFGNKDTTPVGQRKHWPNEHYLTGHYWMMRNREGQKTWPNSGLYKPFADDHGSGGKDNKAMAILPIPGGSVKVYDSRGKHIDTFAKFGKPHTGEPKGNRYYSALYAYQIGNIAQQNTGSRLIRIGDMPLTDADFRSGRFR